MLYLVRHGAAVTRPDLPSAQWHLSREGRAAVDSLADGPFWTDVRGLHSSAEPKATATAQRIAARHGLSLRIEPELREVERPWVEGSYPDAVRRYLTGEALAEWEAPGEALARVRSCIDSIAAGQRGRDVGVVSHGLALTLYLSDVLGLDADAAFRLWSRIGFPDVAALDPQSRRIERGFGGT